MKNNKEEIKKLIEMGFNLELLSFELDVPIEELKQYKKEIEQIAKASSSQTINAKKVVSKKSELIHSEMEKIRQKYKKLFLAKDEKEEPKTPPKLTKQQLEEIQLYQK